MYLLFDIGGTKMRIARARDGASFDEPVVLATPKNDFREGVRMVADAARELAEGEEISAAFGGVAGPLDMEKSTLVRAPHIPGWVGKPLRAELERALGCRVALENDAALAGLGEAVAGAGKGFEIVAYVTVSTGVGGARIVDGRIDRNRFGFEIGHQIVRIDEVDASSGFAVEAGHIESYISGTAFVECYGVKAAEVRDNVAWDRAAQELAVALNNVAVFWSPDVIVLGGSMVTGDPAIPFEKVENYFNNVLKIFPEKPVLRKAVLGDFGGLQGALVLATSSKYV
jgi:glucokinase